MWWIECQAGTGATVAQVPGPRPKSVRQVPEPQCPYEPGPHSLPITIELPMVLVRRRLTLTSKPCAMP